MLGKGRELPACLDAGAQGRLAEFGRSEGQALPARTRLGVGWLTNVKALKGALISGRQMLLALPNYPF